MKLLQLNTWHLGLLKKIVDVIQKENPDVICLQEVPDAPGTLGGVASTLTELQDIIHYPYVYYSPALTFDLMTEDVKWGNAILSKFPIPESDTTFTFGTYTEQFAFKSHDRNIRNFQHVVLDINGTPVHVLNHHGYHVSEHKNGNETTLEACRKIAEYINGLSGPILLAGDFNLAPNSESMHQFDSLRNLSEEYALTTTRTDLTHKKEVCDYIIVNDAVRVNNFWASDTIASDHQALVLDFELS